MKLWKSKWFVLALCAILLVALFLIRQRNLYQIDPQRVDRITFEDRPETRELTAEEAARFIELYNSAVYAGKSTGDGGTPDYNFTVYFKDGSYMWVNDFNSMRKDFEVSVRNALKVEIAGYYVDSQPLLDFMHSLVEE